MALTKAPPDERRCAGPGAPSSLAGRPPRTGPLPVALAVFLFYLGVEEAHDRRCQTAKDASAEADSSCLFSFRPNRLISHLTSPSLSWRVCSVTGNAKGGSARAPCGITHGTTHGLGCTVLRLGRIVGVEAPSAGVGRDCGRAAGYLRRPAAQAAHRSPAHAGGTGGGVRGAPAVDQ